MRLRIVLWNLFFGTCLFCLTIVTPLPGVYDNVCFTMHLQALILQFLFCYIHIIYSYMYIYIKRRQSERVKDTHQYVILKV